MVTLAGTQNLNEFELHLRAILGLPIPNIDLVRAGASAVVLAANESTATPHLEGLAEALSEAKTDARVFNKPTTRQYRRMAVALAYDEPSANMDEIRDRAKHAASHIKVL
jgi:phosphoribosylglycinamide formyltransferase 2